MLNFKGTTRISFYMCVCCSGSEFLKIGKTGNYKWFLVKLYIYIFCLQSSSHTWSFSWSKSWTSRQGAVLLKARPGKGCSLRTNLALIWPGINVMSGWPTPYKGIMYPLSIYIYFFEIFACTIFYFFWLRSRSCPDH